jgi:hypothetical protein
MRGESLTRVSFPLQKYRPSEIRNSVAIRSLASKGLVLTMHTPTSDYKDAALMTVDSNKDNIVSDSELATQIQVGGGDLEQVASLYKAMDIDGDGKVSGQEFKDSIPDPFSSSAFRQRLNDLTQSSSTGNAHPAAIGNLFRDQADMAKIAAVLAELARKTQV